MYRIHTTLLLPMHIYSIVWDLALGNGTHIIALACKEY